MNKHYTTTEISKLLGVTTATINGWINSNDLKSFKTPGGHNRIRQDILLEFLSENNIPIPLELDTRNKPRILIVEDDEDVRDFVIAVIEDLDFDVDVDMATDGYAAGTKVANFKPDIVVLDIMLPGLNGFEICKQVKSALGTAVKVVAVTGYYSEENKKKILESGADVFMRKPMELEELRGNLTRLVKSFGTKYNLKKKELNEQVITN